MISLDAQQAAQAALAAVHAETSREEGALSGASSWWASLIEADSSLQGAQSAVQAQEAADARLTARLSALLADPNATDVDAARFVADTGPYQGGADVVYQATSGLTPAAAATDVAQATASDVAQAAQSVGSAVASWWKPALLAVAGVALLGLYGRVRG